jgi:hypothetical protein
MRLERAAEARSSTPAVRQKRPCPEVGITGSYAVIPSFRLHLHFQMDHHDLLKADAVRLVAAVVEAARTKGLEPRSLYGIVGYDSSKDAFVKSFAEFAAAETALRKWALLSERHGDRAPFRFALQFVYEYFRRANSAVLNPALLDEIWSDLSAEIVTPSWLTRTVSNLRNFKCDSVPINLGDGLSIQVRESAVLAELGFPDELWPHLIEDWSGWGASPFVLVAETTIPKRPDNIVGLDTVGTMVRSLRAIGTLRLIGAGDVGLSKLFVQRVARFNVGLGGVRSTGPTLDIPGTDYAWNSEIHGDYAVTYDALARLEVSGYKRAPGNLDPALRSFMSSYDRSQGAPDQRLLDTTTALEALFDDKGEIAFKLAFRVASLLAADDDEREAMFNSVKRFYDTRSRVVHGSPLKGKQAASLASVDELRSMARRLLRGLVMFAADESRDIGKELFADLDAVLLNGRRRNELRTLLGLAHGSSWAAASTDSA